MNKTDLAIAVAEKTESTKKLAATMVDSTIECIIEALCNGEDIALRGLGSFVIKEQPARTRRNPRTGESLEVPAKNVVKFKPASTLKDSVANN